MAPREHPELSTSPDRDQFLSGFREQFPEWMRGVTAPDVQVDQSGRVLYRDYRSQEDDGPYYNAELAQDLVMGGADWEEQDQDPVRRLATTFTGRRSIEVEPELEDSPPRT